MSDTSNFVVWIPRLPEGAALRGHICDLIEVYTGGTYYTESMEGDELTLGANDVSLGSVDNLDTDLRELVASGWKQPCPECDGGKVIQGGLGLPVLCDTCSGHGFILQQVGDFAWSINDEPAYEWLGSIIMHVPGWPDFGGSCDADGGVVLDAHTIVELVESAEDLLTLKAEVMSLSGSAHIKALRALSPVPAA